MKFVRDLNIGDRIQAVKYGKTITGVITKKLAGAVVINNDKNNKLEVVDIDRVKQTMTKKDEQDKQDKQETTK